MDPNVTVLRVKRKRGTEPANSLLLACKRFRPETLQSSSETVPESKVDNSVFKFVATVPTQDAPVHTHVRQALAGTRAVHALHPATASSQRIVCDLRRNKWSTHREHRYTILSRYRAGLSSPAEQQPHSSVGVEKNFAEIQLFDLIHEDLTDQYTLTGKMKASEPEVILGNCTKMLQEDLSMSWTREEEEEDFEIPEDFEYDLYFQEVMKLSWIQDILSVRAYADEGELAPDLVVEEEVYEDEDDENDEGNWRNDYPDDESDADSDSEERYGGYWEEELDLD